MTDARLLFSCEFHFCSTNSRVRPVAGKFEKHCIKWGASNQIQIPTRIPEKIVVALFSGIFVNSGILVIASKYYQLLFTSGFFKGHFSGFGGRWICRKIEYKLEFWKNLWVYLRKCLIFVQIFIDLWILLKKLVRKFEKFLSSVFPSSVFMQTSKTNLMYKLI